tara:strand:+ start:195 stop:848 length:654 start_codon:yes stop_codon:yes gene_type:complete
VRQASIRVTALCGYPSWDPEERKFRKIDWTARYLVKALKEDMGALSRSYVMLGKPPQRFDHTNYKRLHEAFFKWGAQRISEMNVINPVVVAVPNSDAIAGSSDYPTKRFAEGIAAAYGPGCQAFSGLRFSEVMPKSHLNGGRDKSRLYQKMVLTEDYPGGTPILFDDVCTSGAHLFAAQRRLEPWLAEYALVGGKTFNDPPEKMLNIDPVEITTIWR